MRYLTSAIVAVAACFSSSFVQAQAAPITLQTVVHKEEVSLNDAGERESRLLPVSTAVPGDQVVYTLTFANAGDAVAAGVTVVDPIPEQMRYVDGSAFGPGTEISFSVDGGQHFAAASDLRVSSGSGATRAARAEDFTHIRWVLRSDLEPGARSYARFRAVLN